MEVFHLPHLAGDYFFSFYLWNQLNLPSFLHLWVLACVSQTPEKILDPKSYFTCTKFITKNSIVDNFESLNILSFPRLRNTSSQIVRKRPAICRNGIRTLLFRHENSSARIFGKRTLGPKFHAACSYVVLKVGHRNYTRYWTRVTLT